MGRQFNRFFMLVLFNWIAGVFCATDWDFVLLRIEYNTSDAQLLDFDIRPIRVSPGVYAVNGTLFLGSDLDDTNSVNLKLYRSASGSSQFRATPFEIPTTSFYKFMTSIYVKMLQKDLVKCTNLPRYDESFEGPLSRNSYVFNKCIITNDGMPGHVQPGLYRATGHLNSEMVDLWVSIFFEVNTKSMI